MRPPRPTPTLASLAISRRALLAAIPLAGFQQVSTSHLQTLIDQPKAEVRIPPGRYRLTAPLLLRSHLRLILDGVTLVRAWDGSRKGRPGGAMLTTSLHAMFFPGEEVPDEGTDTSAGQPVVENVQIVGGTLEVPDGIGGPGLCLVRARDASVEQLEVRGCRADWSVQLAGVRIVAKDLTVHSHDVLYSDGVHVDSGRDIAVSNCVVHSGDDSYAVGNEYDRPLSGVSIKDCRGSSVRGCALKLYTIEGAHLPSGYALRNFIQNIEVERLVGDGGKLRNGPIAFYGARDTDGRALLKAIKVADSYFSWPRDEAHDGVNAYGLLIRATDDVVFQRCVLEMGEGNEVVVRDCDPQLDLDVRRSA